ncbi:MAG: TraR/DksA C4-type zinc finger protein [Armatimonadetes bacterium]|nr:TraR/DksA C4-type zinc finger protein [Armatimonadota bacterium]
MAALRSPKTTIAAAKKKVGMTSTDRTSQATAKQSSSRELQPRSTPPTRKEVTKAGNVPAAAEKRPTASAARSRSSGINLKKFLAFLEEEQNRLHFELERIQARTARNEKFLASTAGTSQYDDHMADIASEAQDREMDMASRDNAEDLLEQIAVAFEKIKNETYGLCDVCGKPINKARLDALPYAVLCIDCQSLIEG